MSFDVLSDADLTTSQRLIVFACWLQGKRVIMVDVKRYDTMYKGGMWRVCEIGAMPCPVHAHEYVASLYRRMMD